MLVIELVSLALVAGLIGLVCGYFIAAALLPDVAASPARALWRTNPRTALRSSPSGGSPASPSACLGALAAAAASLIKAARMPVLAMAQPQAWQQAQRRWLILQSRSGARGVRGRRRGSVQFGDSSIAGFAVLAALMLGAALILPMVLQIALGLGQRSARQAWSASGSGPTAGSSCPACRWR